MGVASKNLCTTALLEPPSRNRGSATEYTVTTHGPSIVKVQYS